MLGVEEGSGKPVVGVEQGCGKPMLAVCVDRWEEIGLCLYVGGGRWGVCGVVVASLFLMGGERRSVSIRTDWLSADTGMVGTLTCTYQSPGRSCQGQAAQ